MKPSVILYGLGSPKLSTTSPLPANSQLTLIRTWIPCQQAAEKAVKGFLVFHDQRFEKTHDIEALIALAVPFEAQFSSWEVAGQYLMPYSTAFRYPGEELEPDRAEFDRALQEAEGFYTFVLSTLPSQVHP